MRTSVLAIALFSVASLTLGAASSGSMDAGRFDRPKDDFAPEETVLREGTPEEVGLDPAPIDEALRHISAWTERTPDREHPMYGGAVSLLAQDGVVVSRDAVGYELRYTDGKGTELPPEKREKTRTDTIFDIASITKLFTSIAALQQVESGALGLDRPVAEYLPEFGVHGKESITIRQLLTHTSGLPAEVQLWKLPPEQRIPSVLALKPENPPGSAYEYSDPNMIVLGELVSRVASAPLKRVIDEEIIRPLRMRDTGFNPPASKLNRIAATEYQTQPDRGMVRGEVHDENSWSLGGVAGQAGIFSTADDLAVLGQTLLNGGTYQGERILGEDSVDTMLTNYNEEFPENSHGLGFELNQRWYMSGLSGPRSAGHTGYTGTSLVLDPASHSVAVLLTNRVHPSREWGSNNSSREKLAQGLAEAMAVRPSRGSDAWFADAAKPARLSVDLGTVAGRTKVSFDAFVDTQRDTDGTDPLLVEVSTDGGKNWRRVSLAAEGPGAPQGPQQELAGAGHRAWWRVHGWVNANPGQNLRLRWAYAPDAEYTGRGSYVDGVSVVDGEGTLLDGEREPQRFHSQGWRLTDR